MKNILLYLLIFLSVFSFKKEEKIKSKVEKRTLEKIKNDTIFIKEKCAVFISCTPEEIEREKKEYGEDFFYSKSMNYEDTVEYDSSCLNIQTDRYNLGSAQAFTKADLLNADYIKKNIAKITKKG